ncbi:MAG: AzlC family ABC transporter permease [Eubacteriaceae bacterium]|nr:AzlC family ABC transporter permease [Eubacteriaceae bacterium]
MQLKRSLAQALKYTAPVAAGYLSLGAAYGIFIASLGLDPIYGVLMSVFVYAGSLQFAAAYLLKEAASLLEAALLALAINFRHIFYAISMAPIYKGLPFRLYLIFGLTDETYALLSSGCPEGAEMRYYAIFVTLLNHIYWIVGTLIGIWLAFALPFVKSASGIEYAMSALFVTLLSSQWAGSSKSSRISCIIGLIGSIAATVLVSGNMFVPAALAIIAASLAVFTLKEGEEAQ